MPLVDFLDRIPTDSEVIGNILDCRMPRKFDDMSFKCSGICPFWIGEAKVDLPDGLTLSTRHPRNPQSDIDLLSPNRQGVKNSHDSTSATDIPAMTTGAAESMIFLGDRKGNRPLLIFRVDVSISVNAKYMVQYACGHASVDGKLKVYQKWQ